MNTNTAEREPDSVEALLPWHAAGTLNARDTRRVEEALARDPQLARQYAAVRDELAETIHLNEDLGAPSAKAMQKLFAAIDKEPARKASASLNLSAKLTEFLASLSPRTLAYAGGAAALALLLQAGVIGAVLVKDRGASFQTASYGGTQAAPGAYALVRFQPTATAADIAGLLDAYKATIVDGPKAGLFRLRIGASAVSNTEMTQLLGKLQAEKVVGLAMAAE
jgi:anti-sigma factor RsiW